MACPVQCPILCPMKMNKKLAGFFKGFFYAASGIVLAVKQERNLRFHIVTAVYVYVLSLFYNFDKTEYILLTILIGGVISLELVNSAIERAVSKPRAEKYHLAGAAKDIAAGAVLVFCVASAICGVVLFGELNVIKSIFAFLLKTPPALIGFLLSLVVSFWFVFFFGEEIENTHKN